jgi:hypothetical protein
MVACLRAGEALYSCIISYATSLEKRCDSNGGLKADQNKLKASGLIS